VNPDNQLQLLIKSSRDGPVFATATLSNDDLLPFDLPGESSLTSTFSSASTSSSFPALLLPPLSLPSSLFLYDTEQLTNAGYTKRSDGSIIISSTSPHLPLSPPISSSSFPSSSKRPYNSEQNERAQLALDLHSYNHASNASNGTACENGIIPLRLTSKDFIAADDIFGACGACVSKYNSTVTHGTSSDSPPPVQPGQLIHADLLKLKDGSIVLFTKDDHCGYAKAVKLYVGKTKAGVQQGWDTLRNHYNERGFSVGQVNTDSEEIFKESASVLQERGILCSLSPPDTHEKSLERTWQTTQKRMHVVEQSLSYVLPLGLQFTLLEHVCDVLNSYGNSKFPSSSPHIVMNGTHNGYDKFPGNLPICFGSFVQSRESIIVPQTGIVVGVTSNSAGSQKVYFPSYNHQKGASILHRKASELTVIRNCPREWNLVPQVIPLRGPASATNQPLLVPLEPVSQPLLNPNSPLLSSSSPPLPPLVPLPIFPPSLPLTSMVDPVVIPSIFIPPPPLSSPQSSISPHSTLSTSTPDSLLLSSTIPLPLLIPIPLPPPIRVYLPPPIISSSSSFPSSSSLCPSPPPSLITPSPIILPPESLSLLPPPVPPLSSFSLPVPGNITLHPPPTLSSPIPVPLRRSERSTKGVTPLRFLLSPTTPALHSPPPLTIASIRRNALARQATARKSQYIIDTSHTRSSMLTNNRHIPVTLLPPKHKSSEISNKEAMTFTGPVAVKIHQSCDKEMFKLLDTFDTMRYIKLWDIEHDAIRLNSQMLYKPKPTEEDPEEWKARFAACGNRIPDELKGDTYAGTADTRNTALITAAFGADAVKNGTLATLRIGNFDLPSAFVNGNRLTRAHTGGKQVVIKIQPGLPHPLAGEWVEVLGPLYGLPWSNKIFWNDFDITMAKAKFYPIQHPDEPCPSTPIDNHIYSRFDPADPNKKMVVSVTVDDGLIIGQDALDFELELIAVLRERYGSNITYKEVTQDFCGSRLTRDPHGALTFDLEKYIMKTVKLAGLENEPGATAPSKDDLFDLPTDTTPCNQPIYSNLMGKVTFIAQVRYDITKEATHLAKFISAPTMSDMEKLVMVLRYLHYTCGDGPTYYTTEGAVLYAWVDVAFAVHINGRSQTGYYLCIGKNSAPFYARAEEQKSCIALGPSEGEYVGMSEVGKAIIRFRQVLAAIGFPQYGPTIVFQDSNSAIKLAEGPSIKRKSKHIFVREHYIRDLIKQDYVKLEKVATADQNADMLTKPKTPSKHIYETERLLNKSSRA
jgi:hypothetical protein